MKQIGKVLFILRAKLGPYNYDDFNAEKKTKRFYEHNQVFANGVTYTGQKNWQCVKDGRGILFLKDKMIIEGHWENGLLIKGREIKTDGSYGHYLNGKANGRGA